MLQPVDSSAGQVSGVDDLGAAPSSVMNWESDEADVSRPRPGLTTYTFAVGTISASPVIGLERWTNYVIVVTQDRKLWAISDGNPTTIVALSSSSTSTQLEGSGRPVFAVGEEHIYIAGGGRLQRWGPELALSEVVSASPLATHVASLGQRLVTNIAGNAALANVYQWSDIGEGTWTVWPAANTATADARPDPIVAVSENASELIIWGSETTQTFGIGSDPTFPFDQVSTVNVGLAAPYAYVRLDDSFAFLDNRRRIVTGDGRQAEPISDAIQRDLRRLTTISDAWMYREERGQQSQLVCRFPTEARTFVYDLKAKKWGERDYYVAPFHVDYPVGAHVYWPTQNYHLLGSTLSSGGLYRLDETSRQDLGGALVCERTSGWHDFGTGNRKRSSRMRFTLRRGTATQGATPGALEVRVQNDDGPWSTWKHISVGAPEDYQQTRDLFACNGVFRRRRYGFRFSNTEDMSLVSVTDDVTDLESP
jgi:hypothetical protein